MNSRAVFGCRRTLKNKSLLIQNKCSVHKNHVMREVESLNIPQRVERGPTDILKALSNTVSSKKLNVEYSVKSVLSAQRSENGDSYFQRALALSYESGRKAAQWIVARNPQYFQYEAAAPHIDAFSPPPKCDENSEVSEETLINAIQSIEVEHSIKIYQLLKKKNISVSQSTKQQLLELTCFTNGRNMQNGTMVLSRYLEEGPRKGQWDENGFPVQLFYEMAHDAKSYSAIILGSARHGSHAFGYTLFREAESHGIKFGIEVYNAIFVELCRDKGFIDEPEFIMRGLFEDMERWNLKPNEKTLEQSLVAILTLKKTPAMQLFAMKIVNEFKRIGVRPSMKAYNFLWTVFARKSPQADLSRGQIKVGLEILKCVEDEMPPFRNREDANVFSKMMISAFAAGDLEFAKKIDCVLNKGSNLSCLNGNIIQLVYYSHFLELLFTFGTVHDISTYFPRVMNAWTIQGKVYKTILKALKKREDVKAILPIVCEHNMGRLGNNLGWDNIQTLLEMLEENGSEMRNNIDLEVAEEAWNDPDLPTSPGRWSAIASKILGIFSRHNRKDLADQVFHQVLKSRDAKLDYSSLRGYLGICLNHGDKARIMKCAEYLYRTRDENVREVIKLLKANFELNVREWDRVNLLSGRLEAEINRNEPDPNSN